MTEFSGINPARLLTTIDTVTKDQQTLRSAVTAMQKQFTRQGLDDQPLRSLLLVCSWMDDQVPMLKRRYDLTLISTAPYPGHPGMVEIDESLMTNGPVGIALRLLAEGDTVHPLNINAEELRAITAASKETGISQNLLMAIVWQEQQWYQNIDPAQDSLLTDGGHLFDWTLEQSVKPDKSLGITHMKLATAREVIGREPREFTADGKFLGDLDDSELTKYIEENPDFDIKLSAHYLKQLQANPHGAGSDKQLFLLYAADTQQVRDANALYGDATAPRGGAIHSRAANWDKLKVPLQDANAWADLTDKQRKAALATLAADIPEGQSVNLSPVYAPDGVETTVYGTGPVPPGTPTPSPGPAPTPPED
ncbi:hypothetical protein RVR_1171 [Actinacidiphila reveromycinica]|uniref:Uncharacterized protein n=1 Tax=Actinacidiphila reveromycinica TaxID=659352 RepID=A0A7U3WH02_9ACTN|nr:hypothetical protein [Streptomyces sp. SN-593]BBA96045.1 hypothetical protein RVR_1171 [Streptomyces sp. SN-593]